MSELDKKMKLIGQMNSLSEDIEKTKDSKKKANLQKQANRLLEEWNLLQLSNAPSAPKSRVTSATPNINTQRSKDSLETRLQAIRNEADKKDKIITDLRSGLEELRQTVTANSNSNARPSTSTNKPTFTERLTSRLLPDKNKGESSDEELDMEKIFKGVDIGNIYLLAQKFETPTSFTGLTAEEEEKLENLGGGKRRRKRKTNKKKKKKYSKKRRLSRRR